VGLCGEGSESSDGEWASGEWVIWGLGEWGGVQVRFDEWGWRFDGGSGGYAVVAAAVVMMVSLFWVGREEGWLIAGEGVGLA
jgi:hypothetical protein